MKALFVAAAIALLDPTPPFPAPKLIGVTPDTKCDWGPITEVRPGELVVKTEAGPFEVRLGSSVKLAGADGRPLGSPAELRAGQSVRVYYVVENKVGGGAKAQEIDVLPPPAPAS
jgi:hypothetical protein